MTGIPSRGWRLGDLDLTRPFGIRRPVDLPPDDVITDTLAWLAAAFDALTVTPFELSEGPA